MEMQKREENVFKTDKEIFINKNILNGHQLNTITVQNVIEDLKMKINQLNKSIAIYQKKVKFYDDNNKKYIK